MNSIFKNFSKVNFYYLLVWVGFLLSVSGCKTLSPYFDPSTYNSTIELKAQTLELMKKAEDLFSTYDEHDEEIKQVMDKANSIYEYQKKRKNNKMSILQWELLLKGNKTLNTEGVLTGYFNEWKGSITIGSNFYIQEKMKNVSIAFDEILKLENQKRRKPEEE